MSRFWKITPYHNNDCDICIIPVEKEEDHWDALEYAKERLEAGWDGIEVGEKVVVTMEFCEGELAKEIRGE